PDRQTDWRATCQNCFSKSLAERHRRALGWECASGVARPCDRSEPATSEKIAERIHSLLSRRPDSSWTGERHARRSSCGVGAAEREQCHLVAATRRTPSPLHGRRLKLWLAMNPLHGLTCAEVRGKPHGQSDSDQPNRWPKLPATPPRYELTERSRNYRDRQSTTEAF